jgi:PAS domain S-box-containing protein
MPTLVGLTAYLITCSIIIGFGEAMRTSQRPARLLASIVESSDDAIVSKTVDGIIQTWNASAERLFGYTAAEAIGRHITIIIPPDRQDEEKEILGRIRAGERVEHFETVRLRKDGQHIHISLTISPVFDESGKVVGASKTARDITDRKKAEEKIHSLVAQLQQADRRKDEFLALLAHELRGPLAPLRSTLEIIKRTGDTGNGVDETVDTMDRQLGQLVRLVDDLLDVSRITHNKLALSKERVDLARIIGHAVEASLPLAESLGHQLKVTLPSGPIYLEADPARLAQVFGNLLNNACKYTPPGGRISVTAEQAGSEVLVKVNDTGVGIPSDRLTSVFEMFTQIEQSGEGSLGGLGLGLTLVKRLVEMHDGSVSAHSEGPGRGSEFVVRLPVMSAPLPGNGVVPESVPAAKPRRILVVDDNTDAAASLAMLLKISGNEAHTANEGLEAIEVAEAFRPDVVLLDIGMPNLDGLEVCRRIRAQPWGRDMLMIALTGWGQEEDRRKSKDVGFDHHLVKPVDFPTLVRLLAESGNEAVGR